MKNVVLILALLAIGDTAWAQQRSISAGPSQKADGFRGQNGRRVTFICPATTVPASARVWGSDIYTDDSNVCESALHAGALQPQQAGVVTIVIGGPQKSFKGTARNGVTSIAYGSWHGSMTFDLTRSPGQIEWTTSAQPLPPDFATPLVISCPPQGSLVARIWGTDTYHQDSAICVAAVHAGVITVASGGLVTLTPRAGTLNFTAATRNGVLSVAYRGAGSSFDVGTAQAMIGPGPVMQTAVAQAPTAQAPGAFIGPAPVMQAATGAPPPASAAPANNASNAACGVVFANPCAAALNPASIKLSWADRSDANKFQVLRDGRLIATVDAPGKEYVDEGLDPGQSATYVVRAVRVTGTVDLNGQPSQLRRANNPEPPAPANNSTPAIVDRLANLETSNDTTATTPTLAIPSQVTAQSVGGPKGRVRVAWAPVAGANGYLVYRDGNPLPLDSGAAESNASYDSGVPLGRHRYQVEALFTTANTRRTVNSQASPEAFAEVAFPQPSARFLSQPGDPNDPQELERHYRTLCGAAVWRSTQECADLVPILMSQTNFTEWWDKEEPRNWVVAKFADDAVLGRNREVNCAPRRTTSGPILCWARSTPNSRSAHNNATNSTSVILAYADGRSFYGIWDLRTKIRLGGSFWYDDNRTFISSDPSVVDAAKLDARFSTVFDAQGAKPVPHVCLSCHGGRFDPKSNLVVGASLLPLIPKQLSGFASNYTVDPIDEESIRKLNAIVLSSNPAPAIVAQINSMYGGSPSAPGSRADNNAVPAGWRSDPNIYHQVIEPYCASCHFAQRGALAFATANDVKTMKDAIQNSVCKTFTMPHAEIQFRRFWTEGGLMSLPGLLSTWLGFNSCGP